MSTLPNSHLTAQDVTLVAGDRPLINNLNLTLKPGEIIAVLGTNGAGKTTLLETLCQLRTPASGTVLLDDTSIVDIAPQQRAARIGLMPQSIDDGFDHQVAQRVALGCYARGGVWQWQHGDDRAASVEALERVGLAGFATRNTATLSGGERQRVALAMLLAQRPTLMLLDEPFSQLDPVHQSQAMGVLRQARDAGHGIAVSLHDVNAAVRLADRALLLFGDGRWLLDDAAQVLTADRLSELYATPVRALDDGAFFSVYG
ncbi:MAG: ABC transporter ATP-binding protein [Gammaproteobacteria bacterium]